MEKSLPIYYFLPKNRSSILHSMDCVAMNMRKKIQWYFIKRGEEETLQSVEIKKCSCSVVCAAQYINGSLEKILCALHIYVSHKSVYTPPISAVNLVYLFKGQYYRN